MNNAATTTCDFMSELQGTLLAIVQEMFHNDTIECDDDFFLVGGHSLLGTQLVVRIRKAFGVKIFLNDPVEASTVAQLAVRIEELLELLVAEIDALSDEEVARVSR